MKKFLKKEKNLRADFAGTYKLIVEEFISILHLAGLRGSRHIRSEFAPCFSPWGDTALYPAQPKSISFLLYGGVRTGQEDFVS